jgi:hypothetical protein
MDKEAVKRKMSDKERAFGGTLGGSMPEPVWPATISYQINLNRIVTTKYTKYTNVGNAVILFSCGLCILWSKQYELS